MPARVELFKDGDHLAIVTNAVDENEFWEAFCNLLGNMIADDVEAPGGPEDAPPHYGGDWGFQLRYWLPEATDIVCRLRGYKNGVREDRLLIAGDFPPESLHRVGVIDPVTERALDLAERGA